MKSKNVDPVFILGVPRSGTTLLRVIMDSHSKVLGAPETAWITGGYGGFSIRQLVDSMGNENIGATKNLDGISHQDLINSARLFINNILSNYLIKNKKELLILKTPDDIRYLNFLHKLYPNARYLHIFRDGRDVACSTYRKKDIFFGENVLQEFGELTVLNVLKRWVAWETKTRDFLHGKDDRYIRLSYENLVTNPENVLSSICCFLGIEYESGMLDYSAHKHTYPEWEAGSHDVKNTNIISDSRIGIWRTELPPSKWKQADEIAASLLEALGYIPCNDPCNLSESYLLSSLEEKSKEITELKITVDNLVNNSNKSHTPIEQPNVVEDVTFIRELFSMIHGSLTSELNTLRKLNDSFKYLNSNLNTEFEDKEIDSLFKQANTQLTSTIENFESINAQINTTNIPINNILYIVENNQDLKNLFSLEIQQLGDRLQEENAKRDKTLSQLVDSSELESVVTCITNALDMLRNSMDDGHKSFDILIRKLDDLSEASQRNRDDITQFNDRLMDRNEQLDTMIRSLTENSETTKLLNRQIQMQTSIIRTLENDLHEKTNQVQSNIEKISHIEANIESINLILKEKEAQYVQLEAEFSKLKSYNINSEKVIKTQDLEIKRVLKKLNDYEFNWNIQKSRLDAEIVQKTKTISRLQDQINTLKTLTHTLTEEKHAAIQNVFESKTFRTGKLITSPARALKHLYLNKLSTGHTDHHRRTSESQTAGFDLGNQVEGFYGNHRSGWAYAVSSLAHLNTPNGIYLDTFIEKTFVWSPDGIKPHNRPWVGFIHVPPNVPDWFQYEQSNDAIFKTPAWAQSLPYCKGLFTLSNYHKVALQDRFSFPIENLIHPTEIPERLWSWERFKNNKNKKIIQLGWWLRKLHAIFQLPESDYKKIFLKVTEQKYLEDIMDKEKIILVKSGEFSESMYDTAEIVKYLPDSEYDEWLSENIGFVQLYDSSANNAVIECIARGTPLLVNPIEPVIEYLGEEYPFYFKTLDEAVDKASNHDLVLQTHNYLMNCDTRSKLSGEYFAKKLSESIFISQNL